MLCKCFMLFLVLTQGMMQHEDGTAIRFTLYGGISTWNEVFAICNSINGTMLHFHSTDDRDIFLTFSDKWRNDGQLGGDIWTGLFDNDIPGDNFQFFWDNCHEFNDTGTLWSATDPSEPNLKTTENCVRYTPHDGLKTRECYMKFGVACQEVLDSCWFEVFDSMQLNEPSLVGAEHLDFTVDQCQGKCLSLNTSDNLCIAFEFSSRTCKTYMGTSIYILNSPAMNNNFSSNLHIKRCYEGVYVATPPTVPENTSGEPVATCSFTSSTSTSTSTTTFTTTTTADTASTSTTSAPTTTATNTSINTSTSTSTTATTTTTATGTPINTLTATATTIFSATSPIITETTLNGMTTTASKRTSTTTTTTTAPTALTSPVTPEQVYDTSTVVASTVSLSSTSNECWLADRECLCMQYDPGDLAALEKLIASLVLDKKHLSSYRRKKTSAPDHRVTATSIGNFGIAFLALVFISIILLDCGRVSRCVSSLKKNTSDEGNTP